MQIAAGSYVVTGNDMHFTLDPNRWIAISSPTSQWTEINLPTTTEV